MQPGRSRVSHVLGCSSRLGARFLIWSRPQTGGSPSEWSPSLSRVVSSSQCDLSRTGERSLRVRSERHVDDYHEALPRTGCTAHDSLRKATVIARPSFQYRPWMLRLERSRVPRAEMDQ